MIFTEGTLDEFLDKRMNITVSGKDEYSFSDVPDVISVMFIGALIVEAVLKPAGKDEVTVIFDDFERSLGIFCSLFSEGKEDIRNIKINDYTPYNLAASYYICRTGKDEMEQDLLLEFSERIKNSCQTVWPDAFRNMK